MLENVAGAGFGVLLVVMAGRAVLGRADWWAQLSRLAPALAVAPAEVALPAVAAPPAVRHEVIERPAPSPAAPPPTVPWRETFPAAPAVPAAPSAPAEVPTPSDPAAWAAARRRVSITMYTAQWCGACRAARDYLRERGIDYLERDVERDPRALADMRVLNPRGGIPTIDVDGQVLVGFSARAVEDAIDAAARRHPL